MPLASSVNTTEPALRSASDGRGKRGDEARAGEGADLTALKRLILDRTQGNPFFIEEMVQVLFDEGVVMRDGAAMKVARPPLQVHIPTTVQGVLASRIDRLPPDEKQLLQALAVMGRESPLPLIQRVAQSTEDALDGC